MCVLTGNFLGNLMHVKVWEPLILSNYHSSLVYIRFTLKSSVLNVRLLKCFSSVLNNYDLIVVWGTFDSPKHSSRDGIAGSFVSGLWLYFYSFWQVWIITFNKNQTASYLWLIKEKNNLALICDEIHGVTGNNRWDCHFYFILSFFIL